MKAMLLKKKREFVQIPNSFAQNPKISLQARGLGMWIFSLPDEWRFVESFFYGKPASRNTVRKLLHELEDFGFLFRAQKRNETGHFAGAVWYFDPEGIEQNELNTALSEVGAESQILAHGQNTDIGVTDIRHRETINTYPTNTYLKKEESLSPSKREIEEEYLFHLASKAKSSPVGLKQTARSKLASGDRDQIEDFEEWKKDRASEARKAKALKAAERFGREQLIGYQLPDGGIVARITEIEAVERESGPGLSFSVILESGEPQSVFVATAQIEGEAVNAA